jgi:hypothetical protein
MLPLPDTDAATEVAEPAPEFDVPDVPPDVAHALWGAVIIAGMVVAAMSAFKQAVMQIQPAWLDSAVGQWVLRLVPAVLGGLIAWLAPVVLPEAPPLLPWEGSAAIAIGVGAGAWSRDVYRIAKGYAQGRWPGVWSALLPSEVREPDA